MQFPALFAAPKKEVVPVYEKIRRLEAAIPAVLPTLDLDQLTSHTFCDGVYLRRLDVPKGGVIVGKMHDSKNIFMLLKGTMTFTGMDGDVKTVTAPFIAVTQPGDKRVGYAHEDCVTINIHSNPDNCDDLVVLEERYIIPEPPATLEHNTEVRALLERMM